MPAALKTIGTLIAGKLGSGERLKFIVRSARTLYASSAVLILLTWYSAWRNERVSPGQAKFPFPGWKKLRSKFPPDRPNKGTDPGYSPGAGSMSIGATGSVAIKGGGNPGPPDWGGAKAVVKALTNGLGLQDVSDKRNTELTTTGNISDHYIGCRECYAEDISGPVADMDRAARTIMSRLGAHYSGGELVHDVTRSGFRIQILYRTYVGGNHFTHVHVGARKVGYEP